MSHELAALDRTSVRAALFAGVAHTSRLKLLSVIAHGQPQAASELKVCVGLRLHGTVKHLALMREAGLLTMANDPRDGRRQVYQLAPAVPFTNTEQGGSIDFGFMLLRV